MKSLYLRQTALDEYFLANVAQRVGDRPSRNLAPDDDHHDDESYDDHHDDDSHDDHNDDHVKNDVEPKHGMWNMLLGQAKPGGLNHMFGKIEQEINFSFANFFILPSIPHIASLRSLTNLSLINVVRIMRRAFASPKSFDH